MDDAPETGAVGGGEAVAETLGEGGAAVAETLGEGAGGSSCIRGQGALISSLRLLPMTRPCRRVFTAVNVVKLILPRR
jgi:hypothetical protein